MIKVTTIFILAATSIIQSCSKPEIHTDQSGTPIDPLSEMIQKRLPTPGSPLRVKIAGDTIKSELSLPKFYKQRGFKPAWIKDEHSARIGSLMREIIDSKSDGLKPIDFHRQALETLIDDLNRRKKMGIEIPTDRLIDIEFLLTDAYLLLANQLHSGKIKPKMPGYEWHIPQNDREDAVLVLEKTLTAVEKDPIRKSLQDLRPQMPEYNWLRDALMKYRKLSEKGGWKIVTPGPTLHPGDRDKRVPLLRSRLISSEDLIVPKKSTNNNGPKPDPRLFDEPLKTALIHFQKRHGITPDGTLGKGTVTALNISALKRVRQLELNLERLRWLPREMSEKYIKVNLAAFELNVIEGSSSVLSMPVVIGNQYRHTPVFTAQMTHLILNPYWFVPSKIAIEDLLPKLKKDPDYLKNHGFTVLKKDAANSFVETDATGIDWKKLDDENFEYRLRQEPGDSNALGRVKFVFSNKFNIYMHDTPSKDLFKKRIRDFSSGCIRLQKPMELVKYLLKFEIFETDEAEKKITLTEPIPVHILYETAWRDAAGIVHFRPDIYSQDELLDQYL